MTDIDPAVLDRFMPYYQHYHPEQLDTLPTILTSYKGNEDKLWDKLTKKNPWPPEGGLPEPEAPAAQGEEQLQRKPSVASAQQPQVSRKNSVQSQPQVSRKGSAVVSRKGSSASIAKALEAPAAAEGEVPQTVRQNLEHSGAARSSQPAASQPALSRQASRVSARGSQSGQRPASEAASQKPPASQPALSRQGSRISPSAPDAAMPGSLSRKQSAISQQQSHSGEPLARQLSSASRGARDSPIAPAAPEASINSMVGGVQRQISGLFSALKQPSVSGYQEEIERLQARVADLEAESQALTLRLDETQSAKQTLEQDCTRLRAQASQLGRSNSQLQVPPNTAETDRLTGELRKQKSELDKVKTAAQQADARSEREVAEALQRAAVAERETQRLRQELGSYRDTAAQLQQVMRSNAEKDAHIKDLREQLQKAQSAIIHATQTGFENDVKLHQARATLCKLLKARGGQPPPSPERRRYGSPVLTGGSMSPPRPGY